MSDIGLTGTCPPRRGTVMPPKVYLDTGKKAGNKQRPPNFTYSVRRFIMGLLLCSMPHEKDMLGR